MQNNLRDDFAKRAMEALTANTITEYTSAWNKIKQFFGVKAKGKYTTADEIAIARVAYDIADAMMEEREKRMTNG